MPGSLREIKDAVAALSHEQLSEFRAWYERFEAEKWDGQIERDANDGRLDAIADAALADHAAGLVPTGSGSGGRIRRDRTAGSTPA